MLVATIWVMMILNIYAKNRGKSIITMFVLIDLKREIKEETVFVLKAKTRISNSLQKRKLFE